MKIPLAAVLGFCVLTAPSQAAAMLAEELSQPIQETQPAADKAPSSPRAFAPKAAQGQSQPTAEPKAGPAIPASQNTEEPQKQESKTANPKTKSAAKKKRHRKKVAMSTAIPEKKVIHIGGTADPVVQLAPGMSEEQASSQRQSTSQLLAATDANLQQISSRQLNSTQEDSVSQIKKYMEQARAAEKAGDVQRAHNLASKAVMLSDDLAKH